MLRDALVQTLELTDEVEGSIIFVCFWFALSFRLAMFHYVFMRPPILNFLWPGIFAGVGAIPASRAYGYGAGGTRF